MIHVYCYKLRLSCFHRRKLGLDHFKERCIHWRSASALEHANLAVFEPLSYHLGHSACIDNTAHTSAIDFVAHLDSLDGEIGLDLQQGIDHRLFFRLIGRGG